jgi:hypothetical protein
MKKGIVLAMYFWSACLFAQSGLRRDPGELIGIFGDKTTTDRARALHLPDNAKLLGVFDWDRDGRAEIFAGWTRGASGADDENHLLILREVPGGGTRVEKEYIIRDTPLVSVDFFVPPDRRDTIKMAVNMLGGAYWANVYVLESGFEHPVKLKGATDFEFVDLNSDGVYEAVAWDRRPQDLRCHFGMFGVRIVPEVFVHDRTEYRSVWPMKKAGWHEVMSLFADLDHDGTAEIVSLEDNGTDSAGAQWARSGKGSRYRIPSVPGKELMAFWRIG